MTTPNPAAPPATDTLEEPNDGAALTQLIADALADGLTYPAAERQPAVHAITATFRPNGYPPHIADAIRANNTAIADAILHLIKTSGYTITPTKAHNAQSR